MDPVLAELIKGPPGDTHAQQLKWLEGLRQLFASVSESTLSRVAEPLQAAITLLTRVGAEQLSDAELEQADAHLMGHLLHARGLALYTYLEELNAVRNLVAAEVQRLQPGSDDRNKGERLQSAYEQALDALGRAYNGLREGNYEALKAAGPVLEQVRKTAQELGGS